MRNLDLKTTHKTLKNGIWRNVMKINNSKNLFAELAVDKMFLNEIK